MKRITPFAAILTPLFFFGCSSTSPLTIEEHGTSIAQSIGSDISDLKYISPGDFAPMDKLTDGFDLSTKGIIALTESSLFWREGQDENAIENPFKEIPLVSLEGAALDNGVLQLKISEEVYVLRITQWNPFQASPGQTSKFLELLRTRGVPEYAVDSSYAGKRFNSSGKGPEHWNYDHPRTWTESVHVTDENGYPIRKTVTKTRD